MLSLAGSERYEDSKAHSRQLMNESRENNKSLLNLKECVRARAVAGSEEKFVHIPYRSSRLTWVLKVRFYLWFLYTRLTWTYSHCSIWRARASPRRALSHTYRRTSRMSRTASARLDMPRRSASLLRAARRPRTTPRTRAHGATRIRSSGSRKPTKIRSSLEG